MFATFIVQSTDLNVSLSFLVGLYFILRTEPLSVIGCTRGKKKGRIYFKKQNLLSILSVWDLVQLKCCNSEDVTEATSPELGLLAFTCVLGLLFIFLWICLRNNQQQDVEPDAERDTMDDPLISDDLDETATLNEPPPFSSVRGPEPNAEDYMRWLVERCSRHRDNAPTHERRRLYEERATILYGLRSAMGSPAEALRRGALRTIATMRDISDDEPPSHAAIHAPASLRDAQRALNFIRAMEQGSNSGAVMSTNVDMVANPLGRGDAYPPTVPTDGSSSEVDETASEIKRRYR